MDTYKKTTFITLEEMSVAERSDRHTVYRYEDDAGTCVMAIYRVFPGIHFVYRELQRPNSVFRLNMPESRFLIVEQCQEGRIECQIREEFFHLEEDDVVISRTDGSIRDVSFPVDHYCGCDIVIDVEKADIDWQLLRDTQISLETIFKKYSNEKGTYCFFRKNPHMKHIFSGLYSVPETVREGYLRIKVMELLLFLTAAECEQAQPVQQVSTRQIHLAKEVYQYLLERITTHITIEQLTQIFNVSATYLKDSFKGVYGMSIQAFISEQRIRTAAEVLSQTDRTVADIAGEFGYANASKFSAAFRRVMGETPSKYRSRSNHDRS